MAMLERDFYRAELTALQLSGLACGLPACHAVAPLVPGGGAFGPQQEKALLLCSGCERIYYCSVDCQRKAWPAHKAACKVLAARVNPAEAAFAARAPPGPLPAGACSTVIDGLLQQFDAVMRRGDAARAEINPQSFHESAFLLKGRRCRHCRRTPHTGVSRAAFFFCRTCLLAACCSRECVAEYAPVHAANGSCAALASLEKHESFKNLSVVRNGDRILTTVSLDSRRAPPFAGLPAGPATPAAYGDVATTFSMRAWPEYFAWRAAPPFAVLPFGLWLHTTSVYASALTLVNALAAALGEARLGTAARLTVHVIAEGSEFSKLHRYEEIQHVLPALRALDVLSCGPAMLTSTDGTSFFDVSSCPACTAAGVRRRLCLVRATRYAAAAAAAAAAGGAQPDIVAVLNAGERGDHSVGISDADLAAVLARGTPVLMTALAADAARTNEAQLRRAAAAARVRLRFAYPTALNHYADACLHGDGGGGVDVFYQSHSHMVVVCGTPLLA